MCILFITLQNGSCYNSFSVGFSQNHYHWTPETTAPVWLSSDHHCQWYLYQELSLLICCKTYSYMRYLLCEMVFFLSCIFFKKQCNLLWVFWVSLIWMIFLIPVSPYLKTLSMVASTKLLHLLEVRFYSLYANVELSSIMPYKFMFIVWLICKMLSYFDVQVLRESFISCTFSHGM